MDKISSKSQMAQWQWQLLSLQQNSKLIQTIDDTMKNLTLPQDEVVISEQAQAIQPDPLQKVLLENGSAPNELADLQYIKTLKD